MPLTKVTNSIINGAPISVLDYGAIGNGVSNDTAAFVAAVADAVAENKALEIPAGTYLLNSEGVNFAAQGLSVFGHGNNTILKFTGTGRGFVLNGGTNGSGIGAMSVSDFLIVGNPNITDGFFQTGVFRSIFRNIEVRECNNNAFTILHGVSNQYDTLKYSTNEAAQTTTPTNGLVLDNNGVGYYTADCTFTNCIMEGFAGRGCFIVDGQGNVFVGGTFEGVTRGLEITATGFGNKFINVWFEANTLNDAEIYGNSNIFDGCYFGSNTPSQLNVQLVTAQGTVFNSGFIRAVNMQIVSNDSAFFGCGLSSNVALNFQGAGTFKRVACKKIDINAAVVGVFIDIIGESGSWTPAFASSGGGTQGAATIEFGQYTLVGSMCSITGRMSVPKGTLNAGDISVSGLPFTSKNVVGFLQFIIAGSWNNITLSAGFSHIALIINPNSTVAVLSQSGNAGLSAQISLASFPDPMILNFSGSFEIAE